MKTHARIFLLPWAAVMLLSVMAAAQTTIDQRLIVTRNDGSAGGILTIALQVKATNLVGHNTLGTATVDILYDALRLTYSDCTTPDAPSGISYANGYSKSVTANPGTIRFGVLGNGVDGVARTGTDLTTSYVTWCTVSFSIVNASLGATITIDPVTNQIGLFAQEGNSNGAGKAGNGIILDQTLSTPIVINEIPLPVELMSFTVAAERSGMTRLAWKTATETNNAGFEIERASAVLAPQSRVWTKIAFVEGAGTTASERSYVFTVRDLTAGRFLYRLKQIDRDGGARYSEALEAPAVLPQEFRLMQNYPNPFNPTSLIGFALPEDSHVSIVVYDITGREAAVILNEARAAGYYTVAFDAGALSSGVYFYRMTARGAKTTFSAVKRCVVMH